MVTISVQKEYKWSGKTPKETTWLDHTKEPNLVTSFN